MSIPEITQTPETRKRFVSRARFLCCLGKWLMEKHSHNGWNKDRGSDALEQHVGDWLKHRVGDKEYGERGIVLSHGETKLLAQSCNFGIPDVGAVKEGEQVQEAELLLLAMQVKG